MKNNYYFTSKKSFKKSFFIEIKFLLLQYV